MHKSFLVLDSVSLSVPTAHSSESYLHTHLFLITVLLHKNGKGDKMELSKEQTELVCTMSRIIRLLVEPEVF